MLKISFSDKGLFSEWYQSIPSSIWYNYCCNINDLIAVWRAMSHSELHCIPLASANFLLTWLSCKSHYCSPHHTQDEVNWIAFSWYHPRGPWVLVHPVGLWCQIWKDNAIKCQGNMATDEEYGNIVFHVLKALTLQVTWCSEPTIKNDTKSDLYRACVPCAIIAKVTHQHQTYNAFSIIYI